MRLDDIAKSLRWRCLTPELAGAATMDVQRACVAGFLSDVLAQAPKGGLLITTQVHTTVIAVALSAGLAAVTFAEGRAPSDSVTQRAAAAGLILYASDDITFDLAGRLYGLGLRGGHA